MKRLKIHGIDAAGTRSATTFLRGDETWAEPVVEAGDVTLDMVAPDPTNPPADGDRVAWDDALGQFVPVNPPDPTPALADIEVPGPPADGDHVVWDTGLGHLVTEPMPVPPPETCLVPVTTVVGGVPQLVWDGDDSLVLTEVTL